MFYQEKKLQLVRELYFQLLMCVGARHIELKGNAIETDDYDPMISEGDKEHNK